MGWNFKKELARKFVHLLSIFILFIYFIASDIFNKKIALVILVLILIIFLEFEYLRIEAGGKIPILRDIWKYVRRAKEKNKLGGDVFFLLGAILVLAVFDLKVAMAAILMTTFGDMSAALIGTRFGSHKFFKDKSWEGTLSEFFVDILIGFFVFFGINFSLVYSLELWTIILVMAITATFVETVVHKMDDNLLIPIFSGFAGQIALFLFGHFL
jgi:phytol kinase